MKKYKISFFSLLLLIIVAIIAFVILLNGSNKASQDVDAQDSASQVTQSPTLALSPTTAPVPTVKESSAGLFPASQTINGETKYGYINKSGEYVIEPAFEMASAYYEGAAIANLNNKYCVIDEGGNVLFTNDNPIHDYSNGAAVYQTVDANYNSSYGYIDAKGNILIKAQYVLASNFDTNNTAYVSHGKGNYSKIDKSGKILESYNLGSKYGYAWSLEDGYLVYTKSDSYTYGVVNLQGETIFEPIYSEITYLGNDLFAMKEPGLESYEVNSLAKQAIFNVKGEQLTDYIYYDLTPFYQGFASATNDASTFFVGMDGQIVADLPKFEGTGTLRLFGDVISVAVDDDQQYYTKEKTLIWQADHTIALTNNLLIKQLKFKPIRGVLVYYPQLEGLTNTTIQKQINDELKRIFTDSRKDLTKEDMLSVDDSFSVKLMHNLLIVERSGYDYPYGAAHGMPLRNYFYIDIASGAFYELKDLMTEGSDYTIKINQLITNEITAASETEGSMYFPESFTGIAENQSFRLEEDAIVIYFHPYDIAAYAAGFPEFIIPFDDISEYINYAGAFWKSFHE